MGVISFLGLMVLPGAWLGFWKRLPVREFTARLALSIALSPLVLSLQFWLYKAVGLSIGSVSWGLLLVNSPSVLLMGTQLPRSVGQLASTATIWKVTGTVLPVIWVAANWVSFAGLRSYGWHNLMHADICYQLARAPLIPEEPEIAGRTLSYSWFGHGYWTALALASDQAPTAVSSLTTLILLLSIFSLLYYAGRRLGLSEPAAIFVAGLGLFTSHALGETLHFAAAGLRITNLNLELFFADQRLTTLLDKFVSMDGMTLAFALLSALLFLSVSYLRAPAFATALVAVLTLTGIGLIYTIAFPAAVVLLAANVAQRIFLSDRGKGWSSYGPVLWIGFGCLVAGLITMAWLRQATQGESTPLFVFESGYTIKKKGIRLACAIGPFFVLALLGLIFEIKEKSWRGLGLFLAAIIYCLVYPVFSIRGLEYKHFYFAALCLALVGAMAVDRLDGRWKRLRWPLALGVPLLLGCLSWAHRFHFHANMPSTLGAAAPVNRSFYLDLVPDDPNAAWVRTVRESTPSDSVFIGRNLPFHAGSFVARTLYFPCDHGVKSPGYNLSNFENLCTYRGCPKDVYLHREAVVGSLYDAQEEQTFEEIVAELGTLERPVVIHSSEGEVPFLKWLMAHNRGACVYKDDRNIVWLLNRESFGQ